MKMRKTFLVRDPLNDDFAGTNIRPRPLPPDYRYRSASRLRRGLDFCLHHFIATPLVYVFQKLVWHERLVGRRRIRPYLKQGVYLYGNHTRAAGDAYTPSLVAFPRRPFLVVNPDAVAIPGVRQLVRALGGIPVPSDIRDLARFHRELVDISKGNCVVIYPEAHIWPCYTGIRPFRDASFRYPAETGQPVFAFTVTYRRRRFLPLPRTVVYIDGPFLPDPSLTIRENQRKLRDEVYNAMCRRSQQSNFRFHEYVEATPAPGKSRPEPEGNT